MKKVECWPPNGGFVCLRSQRLTGEQLMRVALTWSGPNGSGRLIRQFQLRRTANEADTPPPTGHDHQPLAASATLAPIHSLVQFF